MTWKTKSEKMRLKSSAGLFVPNVTWAGMKSKAQCLSIYNRGQSISTVDAFMARQKTFAAP
jgi:hypothetical protein